MKITSKLALTVLVTLAVPGFALAVDDTWDGGVSGGGTGWLTATNWLGDVLPGTMDRVIFGAAGTATTIGINMNGATNNGPNNEAVASITLDATDTINRTINNSSSTAGGTLTINGAAGILVTNDSTHILTFSNGTTQAMNVALASSGTIGGAGAITINSALSGSGFGFTKIGDGTLTLTNSNTYSGGTLINLGTVAATHDGALGLGNVSLTAAAVTLTLSGGATNNYVADNVDLSIVTGSTVNLNFTGTDIVGSLTVNGVAQAPGVYGAADFTEFLGTGTITVIPEPATYAMMFIGAGLLFGVHRLRRKTS